LGWIFLLSALPAESKKKVTLCALCDSAVNYYKKSSLHQFHFVKLPEQKKRFLSSPGEKRFYPHQAVDILGVFVAFTFG
jgi:hypothetical protein